MRHCVLALTVASRPTTSNLVPRQYPRETLPVCARNLASSPIAGGGPALTALRTVHEAPSSLPRLSVPEGFMRPCWLNIQPINNGLKGRETGETMTRGEDFSRGWNVGMPAFEIFLLLSVDGRRKREAFVWPSIGAPSLSFYCRARFPPRGLMRRRQCAFLHALAYRNQWPRVTLRNGDLYRAFFSPHRVTRACRDSSPLSFFFFFPLHLCFLFLPSFLFSFLFHFFSFPLLREMRRCSERKRFLRERRTGGGEKERGELVT